MDFAFFQTAFFVQYKSFVVYVVRAALPQEIMFSLNIRDKLIYEYAEKNSQLSIMECLFSLSKWLVRGGTFRMLKEDHLSKIVKLSSTDLACSMYTSAWA